LHTVYHTVGLHHRQHHKHTVSNRLLTAHQHNTVPFTMVHAGKYTTEDRLHKLNTTQKNNKQHKTHQNKTTPV